MHEQNRIDALKTQSEQARIFTQLGNTLMRTLFDPELPDEQRQKLLGAMQGFRRKQPRMVTFLRYVCLIVGIVFLIWLVIHCL